MITTLTKMERVIHEVPTSFPVYEKGGCAVRYNLDKGRFEFTEDVNLADPDWERLDSWGEWMPYDMPHIEKAEFLHLLSKLIRRTVLDARIGNALETK